MKATRKKKSRKPRARAVRLWLRGHDLDPMLDVFADQACNKPMGLCGPKILRMCFGRLPQTRPFCIEIRLLGGRR